MVRNTDKKSEYFPKQRNLFCGKEFNLCQDFWLVTLNSKGSVNEQAVEALPFERGVR
jgi:hypothetical protein